MNKGDLEDIEAALRRIGDRIEMFRETMIYTIIGSGMIMFIGIVLIGTRL